jgi:hypothetical protein
MNQTNMSTRQVVQGVALEVLCLIKASNQTSALRAVLEALARQEAQRGLALTMELKHVFEQGFVSTNTPNTSLRH